jgi:Zn-dependent protease with chaperone function
MIEYTPKELEGNVNVSSISPVKDFFVLLAGLFGLILFIYILLGILVDIVAGYIPAKFENSLGNLYKASIVHQKQSLEIQQEELKIQKILQKFEPHFARKDLKFTVQVIDEKTVNAFAYPGGHIVVYSQLFNQSKSENEIAFVLAHELGHYAGHDHLRAAGRGLVFVLASVVLFGSDSQISQFISELLSVTHMKFSQKQELKADYYALDLLQKAYGNVDGAVEFMSQMSDADNNDQFTYFFAIAQKQNSRQTIFSE